MKSFLNAYCLVLFAAVVFCFWASGDRATADEQSGKPASWVARVTLEPHMSGDLMHVVEVDGDVCKNAQYISSQVMNEMTNERLGTAMAEIAGGSFNGGGRIRCKGFAPWGAALPQDHIRQTGCVTTGTFGKPSASPWDVLHMLFTEYIVPVEGTDDPPVMNIPDLGTIWTMPTYPYQPCAGDVVKVDWVSNNDITAIRAFAVNVHPQTGPFDKELIQTTSYPGQSIGTFTVILDAGQADTLAGHDALLVEWEVLGMPGMCGGIVRVKP